MGLGCGLFLGYWPFALFFFFRGGGGGGVTF